MASGDRERITAERGDLLLATANLARKLDLEPEQALSAAVDRFDERFRRLERGVREDGADMRTLSPEALDQRWERAKRGK
jgi:uncharacterized protein YabN with tetrapyrrole methylase and pyrophosphatase domain